MNTLKYFIYFLFGFIIFHLLNNILIEGYTNELSLLVSLFKDRTDIGCQNSHHCEDDKYSINSFSSWEEKGIVDDENFYLCNNALSNSIVSTLNSGIRCNRELCCTDTSCEKKYFSQGLNCFDRIKKRGETCPQGIDSEACFNHCCGNQIKGPSQTIFNSIKKFRSIVYNNTDKVTIEGQSLSNSVCNSNFQKDYYSDQESNIISGLDIRNYQYFIILDLTSMKSVIDTYTGGNITTQANDLNDQDVVSIDTITYYDFECIHKYLEHLYTEIIGGIDLDEQTKIQNISNAFNTSEIFTNNETFKIKDELIDDNMDVKGFVNQLSYTDRDSLFSEELYGGAVSKREIQDKFTNFLRFYTNYNEDSLENNSREFLIKDFKLLMILIANPSVMEYDKGRMPLDILLGIEEYEIYNIDNTVFELIM